MSDWAAAVDAFHQAAELNLAGELREGSLLELPDYGQVVMTGDLHGHRRNFRKLVKHCDLSRAAVRHVVLHELLHEEPSRLDAPDLSCELLVAAAEWKIEFPNQVHFLHSNHELAQVSGREIMKDGHSALDAFEAGLARLYGRDHVDDVVGAMNGFIKSFALAARTPKRILLSHSLPDATRMAGFDFGIFARQLGEADFEPDGQVAMLVWGRRHTPAVLDRFAEQFDVDLFIVGHQPQETGYRVVHDRLLILASDHNRGVFLPIDLGKKLSMSELLDRIRPFAAVG